MKKLLALSLLIITPYVSADPIDVSMNCPNGGTRVLTGNYAPLTGKFATETTLNNCINKHGTTSTGTVVAKGSFKISVGSTAQIEAIITNDVTRENNKKSTQKKCERVISGVYDLATNSLDGTVNSSCEKSGTMYTPILELVAGLSESESLEGLEDITLENLQNLDKSEVNALIKSLLEGNELSRDRRRPARFAQALVNGLTAAQQESMQISKASCSDLNYPSMWEWLGACQ
ncbi:MAG: hypothetical protein KAH08_00430 [Methylococcales bacterium]|nr:hypothetical protein [Methylococcales bacterium]